MGPSQSIGRIRTKPNCFDSILLYGIAVSTIDRMLMGTGAIRQLKRIKLRLKMIVCVVYCMAPSIGNIAQCRRHRKEELNNNNTTNNKNWLAQKIHDECNVLQKKTTDKSTLNLNYSEYLKCCNHAYYVSENIMLYSLNGHNSRCLSANVREKLVFALFIIFCLHK